MPGGNILPICAKGAKFLFLFLSAGEKFLLAQFTSGLLFEKRDPRMLASLVSLLSKRSSALRASLIEVGFF